MKSENVNQPNLYRHNSEIGNILPTILIYLYDNAKIISALLMT